ncbi:MAG: 4-hydroxy-tetrahydrodipicolinate reductase [Alphaproteobacteria bacterium]
MSKMQLAISGAAGRMGRALIGLAREMKGIELMGAIEAPGHSAIGKDAGELAGGSSLGLPVTDDALSIIVNAHALIDFSTPSATVEMAGLGAQARIVHVVGTTGLEEEHLSRLDAAARHATVIRAGNFSLGVNLLTQITRLAAERLGDDFDIEIVEMHHRHKVDAPSGTALMLGEAAAQGRQVPLDGVAERGRDGKTGAREKGRIGFSSVRGGGIIGEHMVLFAGEGERLQLSHVAEDRSIFARGALRAAQWGWNEGRGNMGPGMFSMADVLGFGRPQANTPKLSLTE